MRQYAKIQNIKKVHSHVGDNIIYWIEMCYIKAIHKQMSRRSSDVPIL